MFLWRNAPVNGWIPALFQAEQLAGGENFRNVRGILQLLQL
jgi:hypothetical protein